MQRKALAHLIKVLKQDMYDVDISIKGLNEEPLSSTRR
jgi:hypothetical protein